MKKTDREKVLLKYDGHCAYCGKGITYKELQVDHIEAHWHNYTEEQCVKYGLKKGADNIENMNPACRRCNLWKGTMNIETFRKEIQLQLFRLKRDSSNYRMALDFGMIKENNTTIRFYFEF